MNLNETDSENYDWSGGVYQLEVTDRVQAGPEGISNLQASVLAKRTRNLHQRTQKVETEKAPLASPAFTGVPTVPTPSPGTNTKQVVNAEFVLAAFAALINGSPDSLNALNELAAAMNNDPNFAATVANNLGGKLNRNFDNILDAAAARAALGLSNMLSADSPEFTGVPKAPTAAAGTNTTQIANTAFVQAAIALLGSLASLNNISYGQVNAKLTSIATLASGAVDLSAAGGGKITLSANTAFSFTNFELNKTYLLIITANGFTPSWSLGAKHVPVTGNESFGTSGVFYVVLTCIDVTAGSEKLLTTIMKGA